MLKPLSLSTAPLAVDEVVWPDLRPDRAAFEQAVREFPNASLSFVMQRAQEIKDECAHPTT